MDTPGETKTLQPKSTGSYGTVEQDGGRQEPTASPSGQNGQKNTQNTEATSTQNEGEGETEETTEILSGQNRQNTQNTQASSTQTGGEGETQASSEKKRPSGEEVRAWWKTALDTFNCCYKGVDTSLDIVHEVEKI